MPPRFSRAARRWAAVRWTTAPEPVDSLNATSAAASTARAMAAGVRPSALTASWARSTSGASGRPLRAAPKMAARAGASGRSTRMWRSKRPGRMTAGSRESRSLVAAMTMSSGTRRHFSTSRSSSLTVRRASWLPKSSRRWAMESNSSKNRMHGMRSAAKAKARRRLRAASPAYGDATSAVVTWIRLRPNSPADARAMNDFPTPGGPWSRSPFHRSRYARASPAKASMRPNVSFISAFSATMPPTSAKVGRSAGPSTVKWCGSSAAAAAGLVVAGGGAVEATGRAGCVVGNGGPGCAGAGVAATGRSERLPATAQTRPLARRPLTTMPQVSPAVVLLLSSPKRMKPVKMKTACSAARPLRRRSTFGRAARAIHPRTGINASTTSAHGRLHHGPSAPAGRPRRPYSQPIQRMTARPTAPKTRSVVLSTVAIHGQAPASLIRPASVTAKPCPSTTLAATTDPSSSSRL